MRSLYFKEEHILFRETLRNFIEKEVAPFADEWEANEQIPRSTWKRMGEMGFLGLHYPEKYGGMEADFFYSVILNEELVRGNMGGFSAAIGVHSYMATAHLAAAGSEELKQKYLVPAIAGDMIAALGISEPGAGSDVANIKTTAKREGNEYIISGSKTFITNGFYADFVVVACKIKGEDGSTGGISLIIVDGNAEGFSKNKLNKIGWKSSDTGELFFDEVRVPVSNLIGQEGKGFYYIMDSFQLERLIAGIGGIAGAEYALEFTLKYINERKAFGRPISKFQVIRHNLVDLATEIEAAKHFTYHTAWLYDQGEFAVKECSMLKLLNSELGKKAADVCLQCFGGYGYMEEFPIARMFRDARVGTIVGGTSEIMKEIISKMIIDQVQYRPAYQEESTDSVPKVADTQLENIPKTAKEIVLSFANRLRKEKLKEGYSTNFHFKLDGESGGEFTVSIKNGDCKVEEGLHGSAKCEVKAKASDYESVELGREDGQMAVLSGKIMLSDISEMIQFSKLFKRLF